MAGDEGKLAIERLKVRRELRSANEEENSELIEKRAGERGRTVPAPARGLVAVLRELPPWSRLLFLIALLVALLLSGAKLTGNF